MVRIVFITIILIGRIQIILLGLTNIANDRERLSPLPRILLTKSLIKKIRVTRKLIPVTLFFSL